MELEKRAQQAKKTYRRKTPIMGWASWNYYRTHISEEKIKQQAEALVTTGLKECGYEYLNIDDGYFGGRDEKGNLIARKDRFPHGMKVVAEYIHNLGLKAGIYSDGGDNTCGFYYDGEGKNGDGVGLYGHEESDLRKLLLEYDYDFIKVDWCGGLRLGLKEQEQYTKIGTIIEKIRTEKKKDIIYNICRWQFPGAWAVSVADSWRTGADIAPEFSSVMHQLDMIKPLARYCGPGHVNDLDMMQIGNGLTVTEEQTHFGMWCMMSTPLMIGCDLTTLRKETLDLLKNKELIALNQDASCQQAYVIKEQRSKTKLEGEVWLKPLARREEDGKKRVYRKAIALLNRGGQPLTLSVSMKEAGMTGQILNIRELVTHQDQSIRDTVEATLQPHSVSIYLVESTETVSIPDQNSKEEFFWKPVIFLNKEQMEEKREQENAILVDVRTKEEYEAGCLEGAINIPYTDIHAVAKQYLPEKDRPIILYCSTGKRSTQAKMSTEYLGYKTVYCMKWNG